MFPSCGCSQFSAIVFTGPMFKRSMCVASSSCRENFGSSVIAEQTSVAFALLCLSFLPLLGALLVLPIPEPRAAGD